MTLSDADIFDQHLASWQQWCASPWGRIRFAVVAETLGRHVATLQEAAGGRMLRVLDVGGGDGRDSRPLAAAGHEVTILDTSVGMLEVARAEAEEAGIADRVRLVEGSIDDLAALAGDGLDLVLCHFVLQYRPAGTGDLELLAAALRPGGRLSVVAPNPAGAVLGALVRRGPAAALEELDRETSEAVTFEHEVAQDRPRRDGLRPGVGRPRRRRGGTAHAVPTTSSPTTAPSTTRRTSPTSSGSSSRCATASPSCARHGLAARRGAADRRVVRHERPHPEPPDGAFRDGLSPRAGVPEPGQAAERQDGGHPAVPRAVPAPDRVVGEERGVDDGEGADDEDADQLDPDRHPGQRGRARAGAGRHQVARM